MITTLEYVYGYSAITFVLSGFISVLFIASMLFGLFFLPDKWLPQVRRYLKGPAIFFGITTLLSAITLLVSLLMLVY